MGFLMILRKQCSLFLGFKNIFTSSKNFFFKNERISLSNINNFEKFRFQPCYYAVIHIYGRSLIVTEGDIVTLPQKLRDVKLGDIIRLNCVSKLGSRDYTLKGQPYIDEKLYTCRARVIELTKAPMTYFIKKKRRTRRIKVVKNKQDYTVLRIFEIKIHYLNK
ncbi:hypothetical protein PCANB_000104 [Pneumocystis canis]|nr:hypothetical protein PCANB_000104 [Pneumocystis canis]